MDVDLAFPGDLGPVWQEVIANPACLGAGGRKDMAWQGLVDSARLVTRHVRGSVDHYAVPRTCATHAPVQCLGGSWPAVIIS